MKKLYGYFSLEPVFADSIFKTDTKGRDLSILVTFS